MPDTADQTQPPLEPPVGAAARPAPVALGDLVISWHTDSPMQYDGPCHGPSFEVIFQFGGSAHQLKCAPEDVAPADVPVPEKDERVQVAKRARAEMPYGVPGPWKLTVGGTGRTSWHETKRDATASGLRRVAILDWHARLAATPS
jgi:hypothetical protein